MLRSLKWSCSAIGNVDFFRFLSQNYLKNNNNNNNKTTMVWLCVTVFLIPLLQVSHLTLLPPCLSTSKNITLENVGEDFYNTRSCSDHGGKVHEPLSHSTGGYSSLLSTSSGGGY
ncbi:uncharacterized protein LOC143236427 [Tachypleus tridentatus]|uniref:uncharacterized protein LOC143236427 n=1 Tax=Tachypleus tridentatus TaxID=6853 RepID=UPI003FCF7C3C